MNCAPLKRWLAGHSTDGALVACVAGLSSADLWLRPPNGMDAVPRAQAKLRDIEDRLRKKEAALFESGGVSAVIARDRQGNVTFNFDEGQPQHSVGARSNGK